MPGIPGTGAVRRVGAAASFTCGGVTIPRPDPRASSVMATSLWKEDATISHVQVIEVFISIYVIVLSLCCIMRKQNDRLNVIFS